MIVTTDFGKSTKFSRSQTLSWVPRLSLFRLHDNLLQSRRISTVDKHDNNYSGVFQITPLTSEEKRTIEDHVHLLPGIAGNLAPLWWHEEAVQIGFFGMAKAVRSWRPDGGQTLEKWLAAHANYEIRRAIDRGKAEVTSPELQDFDPPTEDSHEAEVDRRDETEILWARIDALPAPLNKAARAYIEVSNKVVVAQKLGWSLKWLDDALGRAGRLLGVGDRLINLSALLPPAKPKKPAKPKADPRLIEWRGEFFTIVAAAKRAGMDRRTLRGRLDRGWSVEAALTTPVGERVA